MIYTDTLKLARLNLLSQKASEGVRSATQIYAHQPGKIHPEQSREFAEYFTTHFYAPVVEYLEQLEKEAAGIVSGEATDDTKQEEKPVRIAENGKPLPEWAVGTAIDACGDLFAYNAKPQYNIPIRIWSNVLHGAHATYLGRVDLAGRDPATTWKEYK